MEVLPALRCAGSFEPQFTTVAFSCSAQHVGTLHGSAPSLARRRSQRPRAHHELRLRALSFSLRHTAFRLSRTRGDLSGPRPRPGSTCLSGRTGRNGRRGKYPLLCDPEAEDEPTAVQRRSCSGFAVSHFAKGCGGGRRVASVPPRSRNKACHCRSCRRRRPDSMGEMFRGRQTSCKAATCCWRARLWWRGTPPRWCFAANF